jgi:hypothetical protein
MRDGRDLASAQLGDTEFHLIGVRFFDHEFLLSFCLPILRRGPCEIASIRPKPSNPW